MSILNFVGRSRSLGQPLRVGRPNNYTQAGVGPPLQGSGDQEGGVAGVQDNARTPQITSSPNRLQPQQHFGQTQPQVGVTQYDLQNLAYLAGGPGYNYLDRGINFRMPPYSGSGWMPPPMALPIRPNNFKTFTKLPIIGR